MKTIYTTALLALGGIAATAQAQIQAQANDLILGFHALGGQGGSISLEVDLGSISNYSGVPAGTSLPISRLAAADLAATYGSNWASRTDLFWGIIGTSTRTGTGPNGQPADTLWATAPETTPGTQSTPYLPGSLGAQAFASSTIEPLYANAPGSLTGSTTTGNSSATASINAALSGSYAAQDAIQPQESFGFFTPVIDNSTNIASGSYAVSDLYELRPGASSATYLGSFGLSSAGALVFKASASNYAAGAPAITTQPVTQSVAPGGSLTLSVAATGNTPLTYQWYDNGAAISGATGSTYTVPSAVSGTAGSYTVAVSNSVSMVLSSAATVSVTAVSTMPRLINLSVLTTMALTDTTTVGFVVGGSGSEPVLVRADGPSLAAFLGGPLLDNPNESYFNGTTLVASNTGWANNATITTISAQVGAFPLLANSKDAALYIPAAASGNDSVVITSGGTVAGSVLAEIYDATPAASYLTTSPRLINESVLKNMGTSLTVGFTVGGSGARDVLIRAIGPSLGIAPFNLSGVAAAPQMALYSGQTVLQTNSGWSGGTSAQTTALTTAFTATGAFTLPSGSKDSAMLASLQPGTYSVQVTPVAGSASGTILVEVYEAP
jgi:hypothetical protein